MVGTQKTKNRGMSRKVRAVLAGGLVLGVGAAITLAAWNDSEFATGTFTAGQFNLEGSETDGTTFTEHATSDTAATLGFTAPLAGNLSPTDVVYAPFAVRLAAGTTSPANVVVSADSSTGTVTNLTYTLVSTATWGCDAAAVSAGTVLVPAATPVATVPGTPGFTLAAGTPTSDPGAAQNLCFAITAGNVDQGQTGTVTWEFAATSTP